MNRSLRVPAAGALVAATALIGAPTLAHATADPRPNTVVTTDAKGRAVTFNLSQKGKLKSVVVNGETRPIKSAKSQRCIAELVAISDRLPAPMQPNNTQLSIGFILCLAHRS